MLECTSQYPVRSSRTFRVGIGSAVPVTLRETDKRDIRIIQSIPPALEGTRTSTTLRVIKIGTKRYWSPIESKRYRGSPVRRRIDASPNRTVGVFFTIASTTKGGALIPSWCRKYALHTIENPYPSPLPREQTSARYQRKRMTI